eukprot:TRINITY_DN4392_c0_g1_i2.p1 TRINITY_DN4392_c0_g1~~TRINITY_DN4392_c0_g1_i2.p1  ORF type:complete len:353 (-),score=51.84 TRINITY_DN4392_c0_g1_i2:20-1078(-)
MAQHAPVIACGALSREHCVTLLLAGVQAVMLDAAETELICSLPRSHVMAHLRLVTDDVDLEDVISRLVPIVSGIAVHRAHAPDDSAPPDSLLAHIKRHCHNPALRPPNVADIRVVVSGGVCSDDQVARIHSAGIDFGVHTNAFADGLVSLASCLYKCVPSERPDGFIPTLLCYADGRAFSLVYSSLRTLQATFSSGRIVHENETGGREDRLELLNVCLDCESTCLRMTAQSEPLRPGQTSDSQTHQQLSLFGHESDPDSHIVLNLLTVMKDIQRLPQRGETHPEFSFERTATADLAQFLRADEPVAAAASAATLIQDILIHAIGTLNASPEEIARMLSVESLRELLTQPPSH